MEKTVLFSIVGMALWLLVPIRRFGGRVKRIA
jgi:hypothetical protein